MALLTFRHNHFEPLDEVCHACGKRRGQHYSGRNETCSKPSKILKNSAVFIGSGDYRRKNGSNYEFKPDLNYLFRIRKRNGV